MQNIKPLPSSIQPCNECFLDYDFSCNPYVSCGSCDKKLCPDCLSHKCVDGKIRHIELPINFSKINNREKRNLLDMDWISVEDLQPKDKYKHYEPSLEVLVFTHLGIKVAVQWQCGLWVDSNLDDIVGVTHWMDLPKDPM